MNHITFVYRPTTGDRVFAHKPSKDLIVVRWPRRSASAGWSSAGVR